ncbi:hypothetical protein LX16_2816 [Stackebrandtia albiflava]|uniref:Bleomycin resistance protein n=1 Tax=Stackebrandtia albiflava TaxID=406432 RepID=A0A562V2H2_9ACTN|nr:VOC family protein [Stackebrandtia albiflava]TWJ12068.1 hypothetical protein LX16_2816 [Stackebrandtia albiflava]
MVEFTSAVPILPVEDLESALTDYSRLGFTVTPHEGGDYAYARRGHVALHLAKVPETDPARSQVAVYLYVDDADALCREWEGGPGQLIAPTTTGYGMREGAFIDGDGNLIRFGSAVPAEDEEAPAQKPAPAPKRPARRPVRGQKKSRRADDRKTEPAASATPGASG